MSARRTRGPRLEEAVAALAATQHGVVTREQLLSAGVGSNAVDRGVKSARLHGLHRGVYRVGPVIAAHGHLMAAVLASGPSAVVSHRSAAILWGIVGASLRPPAVEVIVRGSDRRRPGIRIRRIATLAEDEVARRDGIPVTAPARTLYDLAAIVRPRTLERAVAEAFSRRLTDADRIVELMARHPKGPGLRALRAVLTPGRPVLTRSEAEERFLALLRKARFDPPEVNVVLAGFEVDFLWRTERLVTEIDGFAFHSSPQAFERDRRRDAVLAAEGVTVVRVTWRQLVTEPEAVIVRLARAHTRARLADHFRTGAS